MDASDSKASICSTCGVVIPPGSPVGHCPACLAGLLVNGSNDPLAGDEAKAARMIGDYELIEEVARGGMGIVYRARQRKLDRIVALKVLTSGEYASPESRQRFRVEAEAAARLQHPGIVAVHDVGEDDGLPWLAMDFIEGKNLAEIAREQPLPGRRAARIVCAVAEAVQHAHERGVAHRDLKPSNILIGSDGQPCVTDFSLAFRFDHDLSITRTGQVFGSPGYIAPEQAFGRESEITPATDIYGLGALLYHLLTGRPPFQAPTVDAILLQLRESNPVSPRRLNPSAPRDLEVICLKCLRKNPANRYGSANEVAEELDRFLHDEPILARPISSAGKAWRWCRRRPAIAALLAMLVGGSFAAFWQIDAALRAESRERQRAESVSIRLQETNLKLEHSNTRLNETIDFVELQRAEDLFRTGDSADALTFLLRILPGIRAIRRPAPDSPQRCRTAITRCLKVCLFRSVAK